MSGKCKHGGPRKYPKSTQPQSRSSVDVDFASRQVEQKRRKAQKTNNDRTFVEQRIIFAAQCGGTPAGALCASTVTRLITNSALFGSGWWQELSITKQVCLSFLFTCNSTTFNHKSSCENFSCHEVCTLGKMQPERIHLISPESACRVCSPSPSKSSLANHPTSLEKYNERYCSKEIFVQEDQMKCNWNLHKSRSSTAIFRQTGSGRRQPRKNRLRDKRIGSQPSWQIGVLNESLPLHWHNYNLSLRNVPTFSCNPKRFIISGMFREQFSVGREVRPSGGKKGALATRRCSTSRWGRTWCRIEWQVTPRNTMTCAHPIFTQKEHNDVHPSHIWDSPLSFEAQTEDTCAIK